MVCGMLFHQQKQSSMSSKYSILPWQAYNLRSFLFTVIREAFRMDKTPNQVSEELCDLSIRLGSSDNVTIVIVKFVHTWTQTNITYSLIHNVMSVTWNFESIKSILTFFSIRIYINRPTDGCWCLIRSLIAAGAENFYSLLSGRFGTLGHFWYEFYLCFLLIFRCSSCFTFVHFLY